MTPGPGNRNRVLLAVLVTVVIGMVGLSFAAVPLYSVFCRVTGFAGTTQRAAGAAATTVARTVTVRFNADVNPELPWHFAPEQRQVTLKLGETALISYQATNHGTSPIVGTAVYNVTPSKAGLYFDKIQCFCFTEQTLAPGETAHLPVAFFVDPAMADDPHLDDVSVITLSYTFYRAKGAPPPEPAPAVPTIERQRNQPRLSRNDPVPAAPGPAAKSTKG